MMCMPNWIFVLLACCTAIGWFVVGYAVHKSVIRGKEK